MAVKQAAKRAELKAMVKDQNLDPQERFAAVLKLAKMPRNGSRVRYRNRCAITGRPHAYYGKFGLCRIQLRDLGSMGLIPGLVKSSW